MGALSESLIGRPRAARRICTIVLRSHDDLVLLLVTGSDAVQRKPVRRLPSPHRRLSRAADFATGRLSLRSSGCCMKTSTRIEIERLGGNPFDCAKGQSFYSSRGAIGGVPCVMNSLLKVSSLWPLPVFSYFALAWSLSLLPNPFQRARLPSSVCVTGLN
jgi:hypothetical protein